MPHEEAPQLSLLQCGTEIAKRAQHRQLNSGPEPTLLPLSALEGQLLRFPI